jgi:hypothetical protein
LFKFILSISKPDIKNGRPIPKEKYIRYVTPILIVSALEDRASKAPNTGPIHGVKPNPNAKPIIKNLNLLILPNLKIFSP